MGAKLGRSQCLLCLQWGAGRCKCKKKDAEKESEKEKCKEDGGKKGGTSKKGKPQLDDLSSASIGHRIICALCQKRPGPGAKWASSLQQTQNEQEKKRKSDAEAEADRWKTHYYNFKEWVLKRESELQKTIAEVVVSLHPGEAQESESAQEALRQGPKERGDLYTNRAKPEGHMRRQVEQVSHTTLMAGAMPSACQRCG